MGKEPANTIELIKQLKDQGIPEEDYGSYYNRFLEAKARKLKIPLSGSFELTPLCNLDCKMCYIHLSGDRFDQKKLLSVDTWEDLIKQSHEAGMLNATLTGGECLTYPGFDEVYLYLYDLGIRPGILSNGILMDERRIRFFKQYPPRMIQVSFYGGSEDAYERVTGHRAFRTVCQNLSRLQEENIPVKITITPNEFMEEDIRAFLKKVETLHIPYFINANLIPPRKNTGRGLHDIPLDRYIELYKIQNEKTKRDLISVDPVDLPDQNHTETKQYGLVCGAGRSAFTIKYDGNMCPCSSLDELTVHPLETGFLSAWKLLNEKVSQYPLPVECGGCIYFDRCLRCIAMHKNAPEEGHCDPRICERTRKLICAGFIPLPEVKPES